MATSPSPQKESSVRINHRMPNMLHVFTRATRPVRAAARTATFFLKILPMLPSRPVDWVTKPPVMEKVRYPTRLGQAEGELYRPSTGGPHPGVIVCGVHYTEFAMFQHLDPTKRKLPLFQFMQQLGKFFLYVYPMFRQAAAS